ncbi:MAG: hypothetical protein JXA71_12325 [Chitinispirillaceae bacterium]|nr:hypothetical protein [Chitinispirillaceae bacterium]
MIRTAVLLLLFLAGGLNATPVIADKPYAAACVYEILNCRYDRALSIADSAASADSCDPLAPLMRLTALGIRDVDFDTLYDTAAFFRAYRRTDALVARHEHETGSSPYSLMLLGICKGIHASFHLRLGAYYAAMQNGFEALDLLEDSRRLDTTNADPLFLLGLYDYARGELKKRLWWMLFWYPGSKERGIERLWTCSRQGALTGNASLFALADIYLRENRLEESGKVLQRLEREFPKSRFMLWQKVDYLELRRLHYEAALCCDLLAASYEKEPAGVHSAFVVRHRQAQLLNRAGQKKEAAVICRSLLKHPPDRRKKVIYKDTEKLLRSLDGR